MPDDLAEALEEVARNMQAAPSPHDTLERITHAAVDLVAGAEHAAITFVTGRKDVETVTATDDLVRAIDQAQYDTQEGPCLDALYEDDMVRMNDIEAEQRWPEFARRARDHGVRSMLCFRLFMRDNDASALNMYAADPDAFTEESESTGRLFATHAAVALAAARKIDQLEHAVDSRDIIGQAKGILMERHDMSADEAFQVLARASQATHVKLIDVARRAAQRN